MLNDAGLYIAGVPSWWHPAKLPAQAEAYKTLVLQLLDSGTAENGVLLYGLYGRGKTSGALGAGYAWARAGKRPVVFKDFGALMLRVKATWNRNAPETAEDVHKELLKPKLLILDDIGKQTAPENVEFLSTLVNARINAGRPTALTTNHDLDTEQGQKDFSAACDARIYERFQNGKVAVEGANLRIRP